MSSLQRQTVKRQKRTADGGRRRRQEEWVLKKGGGGKAAHKWEEENKAARVWQTVYFAIWVHFFFFLLFIPHGHSPPLPSLLSWPHLANICFAHLCLADLGLRISSIHPLMHPSLPASARKFGSNQMFNRQGTPAGFCVNQAIKHTHTYMFKHM